MIAWVNLHLGFVAGLGLVVAFTAIEFLEMMSPGRRRAEAIRRLRSSAPWFGATALATLVNPWGWEIYQALIRQNHAMALHAARIVEWGSVPINWPAARTALSMTNTRGAFYVLLAIAAIATLVALLQRCLGAALLLAGATWLGAQHVRLEALTGCVVVVVGGSFLFLAAQQIRLRVSNPRVRMVLSASFVAVFAALAFARSVDVVTNRRSLVTNDRTYSVLTFGTGLSWWLPERAAGFIEHENLPGEIFNSYDEGGYLVWRLGQKYRDYIDGRAIPFGPESFRRESELLHTSPDSELWQQEADRYNIHTIILPLSRFGGASRSLATFCKSREWMPVYLDEISAVFVRRTPKTEDLIGHLRLDCWLAPLPAGTLLRSPQGSFNQWANAASVLAALGRNSQALAASDRARLIVPGSPFVPWLQGNIYHDEGLRSDAEREYLKAISLEGGEPSLWFSLARLYKDEGRIPESIRAQRRAIDLSSMPQPWELLKLAQLNLEIQEPKVALKTFDEAVRNAAPDVLDGTGARSFKYEEALGRAAAWRALGDTKRAGYFEDEAVRDLLPQQ